MVFRNIETVTVLLYISASLIYQNTKSFFFNASCIRPLGVSCVILIVFMSLFNGTAAKDFFIIQDLITLKRITLQGITQKGNNTTGNYTSGNNTTPVS